jgi:hypothetical protein
VLKRTLGNRFSVCQGVNNVHLDDKARGLMYFDVWGDVPMCCQYIDNDSLRWVDGRTCGVTERDENIHQDGLIPNGTHTGKG